MDLLTSRFFQIGDRQTDNFIFRLYPTWWSRPFEYAWAGKFAEAGDVALDAACGICHPLKFYLLDNCHEVHACDIDQRILSSEEILKEISEVFGVETANNLPRRYLNEIHYTKTSLTDLPYQDRTFDKIYCISVLEHLDDTLNKKPNIAKLKIIKSFFKRGIYVTLKEFKRTLKDDGLIIITLDYPTINLEYFKNTVAEIGLRFVGDVSFDVPQNAVYSEENKLYCFRAVLRKEK